MKINIENKIDNKLIWITASCSNLDEISLKEQLYKKILSHLLINNSISLLTISPQNYSLAYDITPCYTKIINGRSFLINNMVKCDLELVEKIVLSEEFERTLLIIVEKAFDLSDSEVIDIVELIKKKATNLLDVIIFCEDDGNSLCLYNTAIETSELMAMAKSFTANITIEGLRPS